MKRKLIMTDSLVYENVKAAEDSLLKIVPKELSSRNRAYYYLLNTIVRNRLDKGFSSDSAINAAVEGLRNPIPDQNLGRALIYQGVVRYQVKNTPDSLVFVPLKEVEAMIEVYPDLVPVQEEIKLWFYLGILHYNNRNDNLAESFLDKALNRANEMRDVETQVVTSLAVFWRYLSSGNNEKAISVLDNLESLSGVSPELRYDIINAKAAFYLLQGDYANALKGYRDLENQITVMKEKPKLSNVYYSICRAYSGLGKVDSALVFAQKAVDHLPDSVSENDDFHLFSNLGSLAMQQGEFKLAAEQYKKATDFLVENAEERTRKKILELEKQYDLSQARIETLRQKQKLQRFTFAYSAVFVLLLFIFLIYFLNLKRSRVELENERLMRISAEKEVAGKMRESLQRRHLLRFYQLITQREMVAQQRFDMLSQKYIKSDSSAYHELQTELGALKEEFSGMMYNLMNDDLFYSNVDIPAEFSLSNTEKVVLFLLKYEIPSAEIATVLGISNNNLRVRKSNLKKRILENLCDYPSIDDLLSLF
jgi:tetratricopeptide (TPR) repeat protein